VGAGVSNFSWTTPRHELQTIASEWQIRIILPPLGIPPGTHGGRVVMKAIQWIIAAAALALVQPTPASAGVNDPEVIIYRFPGVMDN
jgi:hypothetical protein